MDDELQTQQNPAREGEIEKHIPGLRKRPGATQGGQGRVQAKSKQRDLESMPLIGSAEVECLEVKLSLN